MVDKEVVGKTILVTGGTGSFGSSFVEAVLKFHPKAVRVLSRHEYSQVKMKERFPEVRYFIGDVRDRERLHRALQGVDIVIHAAALKHVPVCEYNPIEAVKTNIMGTVNVIEEAIDCGVQKVLAISTDKAVHPISLYGATKLAMEKVVIYSNVYGDTKFSCVRFGNLWDSSGSVIELWKEQAKTGTLIVTDPKMSRYWITQGEAVRFAIDCLDRMEGGEIFIPVMKSFTLAEVASNISPESKLQLIGKRKGEKMVEELFSEGDTVKKFPDYYVIT